MKASLLDSFSFDLSAKKDATVYLGNSAKTFLLTNFPKDLSSGIVEVTSGQYSAKIHPNESMLISGQHIQIGLAHGSEESAAASVTAELVVSDL